MADREWIPGLPFPFWVRELPFDFSDGGGERGDDFEEVAYDAVIGYFEDGCVFILVDCDDALRALHADEVLDGSGDADG